MSSKLMLPVTVLMLCMIFVSAQGQLRKPDPPQQDGDTSAFGGLQLDQVGPDPRGPKLKVRGKYRRTEDVGMKGIDPTEIRVFKNGEAVPNALVLGYLGYPIEVTEDADGNFQTRALGLTQAADTPGYWKAITDGDGALKMTTDSVTPDAGQPVLVLHKESGYASTTLTGRDGKFAIRLTDWCSAAGTVGPFPLRAHVKTPDVLARWESFPFGPGLMKLGHEDRRMGPGLFSLTRQAPLADGESYRFPRLPEGRIQFSLGYKTSDGPITTNIRWSDSVSLDSSDIAAQTVETIAVAGRVILDDELLERTIHVHHLPDGRRQAKRAGLRIRITPATYVATEAAALSEQDESPLEAAIRKAVVWGRPGGARETRSLNYVYADVRDDGRFLALLRNGAYNISQLWSTVDSSDERSRHGSMNSPADYQLVATIDGHEITAQESDSDGIPIVDLGEIHVNKVYEVAEVVEPGLWISRPAKSPARDRDEEDDDGRHVGASPIASVITNEDSFRAVDSSAPTTGDPIDESLSRLLTQILSAKDQQARDNLREPLQKLLERKFDAEQLAREQLVAELTRRLNEASARVKERAERREAIIGQQVQRMLGLPLDEFQLTPKSEQPRSSSIRRD